MGQFIVSTAGSSSWTVPAGVTSIDFLLIGGGGGGCSAGGGGAGGGGGSRRRTGHAVTSGEVINYTVGAGGAADSNGGDSTFDAITAGGGQGSTSGTGGTGGTGDYTGGVGGDAVFGYAGGGGGSGGETSNGNDGQDGTFGGGAGGTAVGGGGAGGHGDTGSGDPQNGANPGGGGGGSATMTSGGAGGTGYLQIDWNASDNPICAFRYSQTTRMNGDSMWYLRQSTASQEVPLGPFVDDTDGKTAETALSIANTDIKIQKTGATTLANKNSGGATHISAGNYYAVLDATDTDTIGPLRIYVQMTGALAVWLDCCVLDEAVYDVWFGTTAPSTGTALDAAGVRSAVGLASANLDTQLSTIDDFLDTEISAIKTKTDQLTFTVANQVDVTVLGVTAAGLADFFDTNSGTTFASAVAGSVVKEIVDNAGGGSAPTAAQVATAVWQDTTAGDFTVAGSIGKSLFTSGVVPGASGGLFIAGSNAATTVDITGTISTVTTATNVTTVNGLAAGAITAASIAADAITDAKVASDVTIASVTGAVGSVTGNVGGNVTGSVGSIATGGIAAVSFAAGAIDAAAIATDAIGALELAAGAASEIASAVRTELTTELARIDAAVSSRMATYTQPTGFLAATFPGTVASTTNITAGTITTATNVTTVNGLAAGVITAASIADGAIDRATFAADTGLQTIRSGTAQAGTASSIQLDAGASAEANFYRDRWMLLTGGTGAGQVALCTTYDGSTKVQDVVPNWITNPNATTTFAILPASRLGGITGDIDGDLTGNVSGTVTVDAASVRAAIGLASANLDTQLADLPTNAELAASQASADDATLAAIAALNNLSSADVAAQIAAYDAPTKTEMDAAFTQIKGATWSTTDTLEAIRDRGDAAWITATGFATSAALSTVEGKIDTIDANVDSILVDTAEIGTAGAGLTSVPWNAAWDAEVQSECADALVAINLDHLLQSAVDTDFATTVHLNSVIGHLADDGTSASFSRTTDSLEAVRDRGDAAWLTASGFSTLDAAGIRSAVGLASANLDTQLGDLPTNAELSTALGTADDAVLTAIAALNNLSDSQVAAQIAAYDAPTKAEMDAAFTEIKGATWSTGTDTLEAIRDRGDAAWTTPVGFSTLDAAGVRSAVGLAAANLDTQLTALPAIQAKTDNLPASPAAVGSAMTLTAAYDAAKNAATQSSVDDLPTNAEMAVLFAAADDAVLSAIAGLNNVSTLQIAGLLETYDAPTFSEMTAAFTQIKGPTWASTDTLEAIRDRGDAAWVTATGFSTHSAADVWAVGTRVLTAGTNIILAKGVGVTGFNDLSAAQVNAEADTAISDAALATAANLALVQADTTAILNDTQELQTDWDDGGRLDLILDSRASQSSVDDLPTNAEFTAALAAADDAVLAQLALIKGATFDTATDSLESLRNRGDAAWITATGFSTLDAAGIRAAVGLASANLDVQLADLPTVAEFEARTIAAANYMLAASYTVAPTTSEIATALFVDGATNKLKVNADNSVNSEVVISGDDITSLASQINGATAAQIAAALTNVTSVFLVGPLSGGPSHKLVRGSAYLRTHGTAPYIRIPKGLYPTLNTGTASFKILIDRQAALSFAATIISFDDNYWEVYCDLTAAQTATVTISPTSKNTGHDQFWVNLSGDNICLSETYIEVVAGIGVA